MFPIVLKEYECQKCGRYFYIHQNAGEFGVRCPFYCSHGTGREPVFIRLIKAFK